MAVLVLNYALRYHLRGGSDTGIYVLNRALDPEPAGCLSQVFVASLDSRNKHRVKAFFMRKGFFDRLLEARAENYLFAS